MLPRKFFGEEVHRAPFTEEVKVFGEIRTAGVPDSTLSETSLLSIEALRRFRGKALQILISKMANYKRC